jgi:hypothetical protein
VNKRDKRTEPEQGAVTILDDSTLVGLAELVKKLQFRVRAPIEGDAIRVRRVRTIVALWDVATFLNTIGAGNDVSNLFTDLALVFHDLNEGGRPPLAEPAPSSGNRPEPSDIWAVRGIVALGIEVLMRSGMTQDEAIKVAVMHPSLNRLLTRRGADLKKSIKTWHNAAKQADSGGIDVNPMHAAAFRLSHMWDSIPRTSADCEPGGRNILRYAAERAKRLPSG